MMPILKFVQEPHYQSTGSGSLWSFCVFHLLKTWLRSTKIQARMTQLSIFAIQEEKSEKQCLLITRALIYNEGRERKFGRFPQL